MDADAVSWGPAGPGWSGGSQLGALEGGLGGPGAPLAHVGLVLAHCSASLPRYDFSFSRDLAF